MFDNAMHFAAFLTAPLAVFGLMIFFAKKADKKIVDERHPYLSVLEEHFKKDGKKIQKDLAAIGIKETLEEIYKKYKVLAKAGYVQIRHFTYLPRQIRLNPNRPQEPQGPL